MIIDVASKVLEQNLPTLDGVGMDSMEMPVIFEIPGYGRCFHMAECDASISLQCKKSRGIHMSRLFLLLQEKLESQPLCFPLMKSILQEFLSSHKGLTHKSYLAIRSAYPIKRKSLISDNQGWRKYNLEYKASFEAGVFIPQIKISILYSSACPCSAALSRELIQKKFRSKFSKSNNICFEEIHEWLGKEESMVAIAHSQRSQADLTLFPKNWDNFSPEQTINMLEQTLKTPVQGAVKREDEQEFARLNGSNPMFVEDSCRLLKKALLKQDDFNDFQIKVSHFESLHPHNAVAWASKHES